MATFKHKSTGELFTAETYSLDEHGAVWLQRLRLNGTGEYLLGGDAEIDVAYAADPVDEEAKQMLAQAKELAQQDEGVSVPLLDFLRDGLTGFAMRQGAALGREMVKARDARACPKCKAPVGEWCKGKGTPAGPATIHRERRLEPGPLIGSERPVGVEPAQWFWNREKPPTSKAGPYSEGCLDCGALTDDMRVAPLVHAPGCRSGG